MKTKVKRMSKRTLAVVLGVVMLMSCLVAGQITSVNAWGINNGGRVYFDTQGHWADAKYIYFAVWYKDNNVEYRYLERLYNIPNTTVYTADLANRLNNNAVSSMRFIGTTTSWISSSVNSGWRSYEKDNSGYAGKYYTASGGLDINNGDCYYASVSNDNTNSSFNLTYNGQGTGNITNSNWKKNQTVKVQYLNGGSWTDNSDSGKAGYAYVDCVYYSGDQATSAYGHSASSYSTNTYENAALHSYAKLHLDSVASGYSFVGWFNSSGNLLSTDEDYTYYVTDTTTTYARFYKASEAYSTATPAEESKVDGGTLLFKKKSETPTRIWFWQGNGGGKVQTVSQIGSTSIYKYTNNSITTSSNPKAIAFKTTTATDGSDECPGDVYKISGDITPTGTNSSTIYYFQLNDDTDSSNWTNFEHLSVELSSLDKKQVDNPGEPVVITATTSGTLKSNATIKYYYSDNGGSTYYLIEETTNKTTTFYPPATGKYKFFATISDSDGLEVDRPASLQLDLTVGTEGYYVSGNTEFVGANGGVAPSKGKMTETATNGVWKKVFKSVPAGTHDFRITDLDNYLAGTSGSNATQTYALTGDGVELSTSGDNIRFTLDGKSKVTVTVDSKKDGNGKYPVTVKVEEVTPKTVTVYANTGGTVAVTYDGASFDVEEGKSTKIKVGEGDEITLVATQKTGYTFDHWEKNLEESYSVSATINDETINDTTVYVADFGSSSGSGDWTPTNGGTTPAATPTIGNSTTNYLVYSTSDNGPGKSGTQVSTYNSGNYYFADITDVINTNGFYFALSNNTNNNGILGNNSEQLNSQASNIDIKDSSNNTIFKAELRDNSDVTSGKKFVYIHGFDTSKYSAIGVQAVYSGSNVNYQFYYKSASGGGSATEGTEYNAAVSYYAKDSNFMSQSTTKNPNFTIDTNVEAVEDLVTVEDDSANNMVKGKAVKGCNITVSTTISGKCKNGTGDDVYAAEKYYVVGYSFNGITPEILSEVTPNASHEATYTCTYTIPADMEGSKLEITPIYFLKTAYADNTTMFYINGYDDQIKDAGWGNTLFVYPFYRRYKNNNNDKTGGDTTFNGQAQNFSGYPGQPVVNYGGQLYTQIPLTNDGSANGTDSIKNPIKGVTINNGYFDNCHQGYCKFVTNHHQTYDYDDFQKIYKEKQKDSHGDKYLHSIFFSFKYYPQDTTNQHRLYSKTNSASSGARNNDTIASGTRLTTSGTVSDETMTAYSASSAASKNKWEDLTDALGNNVDLFGNTVTKTTDHPIRVVSMGYEYNNSGEYATEWAVYNWNGSNYTLAYDSSSSALENEKELNSSIVPSALVMNKADNFSNYTAMDGDVSIGSYEGLYTELKKYAGYPVKICYEYDAPIKYNNPPAYRCDGRWTYTTVNDFVKSNIKIEYKASGASEYATDTFTNTNEGTTTKCKAYFTNSEYYGAVESNSEIIDATEHYTFKAEEGGSYEFVGWYAKDSAGKYQKIENVSDVYEAESPRTANLTFVARFDYVASGNLTISNTVASDQIGMATTYLGVTVINGSKETILANVASNTSPYKLDKAYIASNSNYQIRIDIRTVPIGENTFTSYACNKTNGSDVKSAETRTYKADDPTFDSQQSFYNSGANTSSSATYTINVKKDIYNSGTTQQIKAIEYVSTLTPVTYNYTIKYNYTSRSYGDQAYTKTGLLTSGQINDETLVTGSAENKSLTDKLLQKLAPHESNFNSTITWNYASATGKTGLYNSETNTYTFNIEVPKAESAASTTRKAYFTVPYKLSSVEGANGLAAITTYGDAPNQLEYGTKATDNKTFEITGTYENIPKASDGNNVTAPVKMLVTGSPAEGNAQYKFFKYWKFSTTKGKEIGKCYYPEFNYVLYENYNVEAVYSSNPGNYNTNSTFGSDYASDTSTSISYIGNSRNQWNSGDNGTLVSPDAGDLIYSDFVISYKPGGNTLIKDIEGAETGIIIQRLDTVTVNSSGKNSITLDDYAAKFATNELDTNLTKIKSYAASDRTTSAKVNGHVAIKVTMPNSTINNKNRIHYAYKLYNTIDGTDQNTKQYFYRVYSYMKVNGTTTVSATPTYFCMYDIATE